MYVIYYILTLSPHSVVCTNFTVLNTKLSFWDAKVFPADSPDKSQLSVSPCVHLSVFHSTLASPGRYNPRVPLDTELHSWGSQMEMRMISGVGL